MKTTKGTERTTKALVATKADAIREIQAAIAPSAPRAAPRIKPAIATVMVSASFGA